MAKRQILSIVFCLFISTGFVLTTAKPKRVRRQIFYEDIQNKPKTFRSRAAEKEKAFNEGGTELIQDIEPSLDPELLQSLLANADISSNAPPKGSPKPKPFYVESYHSAPKPKPTFEETSRPKPTFGKPIRHKPQPAYEELYNLNPFPPQDELYPKRTNYGNFGPDIKFSVGQNYNHGGSSPKPKPQKEKLKNTIPGEPGKDYPIYKEVPYTSFKCDNVPFKPGMYANPETGCQAYHVCHDNRHGPQGASFLCTNGTIFNQETFNCDWWYKVDCSQAESLYSLNSDPNSNPYYKKRAEESQYKSESPAYKPNLSTNLLQESQLSPSYSEIFEPQILPFQDLNFFSSKSVRPNKGSLEQKIVQTLVNPLPDESARSKLKTEESSSPFKHFQIPLNPFSNESTRITKRTESLSAPKRAQTPFNPFSDEAEPEIVKAERTVSPSSSKQYFEIEEKIGKSQEFVRRYEDRSQSINTEKNEKIGVVPTAPSSRRVLRRRRKRPSPGSQSSSQSFIRHRNVDEPKPKHSEITAEDIPEDAIPDFEWGQRTS